MSKEQRNVFVVWLIVAMKNVHLDEKRHLESTGRT
jgi:hypothetical protein